MPKIAAAVLAAGMCLAFCVGSSEAIHLTNMKAIGWYDPNAPIGGAYWFNERVGVQAGFGFSKVAHQSFQTDTATDRDLSISLTAAVPIRLAGPESCHFLFRPSIFFQTNPDSTALVDRALDNIISIRADLAVEYFLSNHLSIVGGTGVAVVSESPKRGNTRTTIEARPLALSQVGFYYYFGKAE